MNVPAGRSDPTAVICSACGSSATADDTYCETCGTTLGGGERPAAFCVECGEGPGQIVNGFCLSCGTKQPVPRDSMQEVGGGGDIAAVSDRGRRRPRNEDAFAIGEMPTGRIVAVISDGVSSTPDADQASQVAVEAGVEAFRSSRDREPAEAVRAAYAAAVVAVNGLDDGTDGTSAAPSCTFLAASASRYHVHLASMGDCRAYWLPEVGEPETLTADDSWATEQIVAGVMNAEQAHADVWSHHLIRWLGGDAEASWEPREVFFTAPGPGRLVLCSDGLWNYAPSPADMAAAAGGGSPSAVARRLVDYANQRGGLDNTTVVVVSIPCGDDLATAKGTPR